MQICQHPWEDLHPFLPYLPEGPNCLKRLQNIVLFNMTLNPPLMRLLLYEYDGHSAKHKSPSSLWEFLCIFMDFLLCQKSIIALCIIKLDFLFWLCAALVWPSCKQIQNGRFCLMFSQQEFDGTLLFSSSSALILILFWRSLQRGLCFFHQHVTQNETVEWNPYHHVIWNVAFQHSKMLWKMPWKAWAFTCLEFEFSKYPC